MAKRAVDIFGGKHLFTFGLFLMLGSLAWSDTVTIQHKPGKGFKVETPDGEFTLTLGGRIQLRHTYEDFDHDRDEDDVSNFTAHRVRIWLKGKAFKEWKYKFHSLNALPLSQMWAWGIL